MSKAEQLEIVESSSSEKPDDVKKLRKLAQEAFSAAQEAMDKYWQLLVYIREAQIAPATITKELPELGYSPQRISEIKRIAFSSNQVFDEYKSKAIGFKLALQKAREEKAKPAEKTTEQGKDAYILQLDSVFVQHVPVAGKVAPWMRKLQIEVNGCIITVTVVRNKDSRVTYGK